MQPLVSICQRHRGAEAVVTGGAAVILELDAASHRGGDESQHRFAMTSFRKNSVILARSTNSKRRYEMLRSARQTLRRTDGRSRHA
jgi:hypothetical protein